MCLDADGPCVWSPRRAAGRASRATTRWDAPSFPHHVYAPPSRVCFISPPRVCFISPPRHVVQNTDTCVLAYLPPVIPRLSKRMSARVNIRRPLLHGLRAALYSPADQSPFTSAGGDQSPFTVPVHIHVHVHVSYFKPYVSSSFFIYFRFISHHHHGMAVYTMCHISIEP